MKKGFHFTMSDTGEIDSMSGGIDPFITVTQANMLIEYLTEYVNRVKDNETVEYLNNNFHKRRAIQQEQEEREILEREAEKKLLPKQPEKCLIYLLYDLSNGFYKIGRTTNLSARIKQLKIANACIDFCDSWEGIETDEAALHSILAHKNVNGEWFDLECSDIQLIHSYFANRQN